MKPHHLARVALLSLLAPVRRVAGYDTVMPLPRIEAHYMPTAGRITVAAKELMEPLTEEAAAAVPGLTPELAGRYLILMTMAMG